MSKKIIIISKKSCELTNNVNSRFYDKDMNPIISNSGINMDGGSYHLGQLSSSFDWAKRDMTYENYKRHFDKLFPEVNGDFVFHFRIIDAKMELATLIWNKIWHKKIF